MTNGSATFVFMFASDDVTWHVFKRFFVHVESQFGRVLFDLSKSIVAYFLIRLDAKLSADVCCSSQSPVFEAASTLCVVLDC